MPQQVQGVSQVSSEVLGFFKDPGASSVLSFAGQQIIAPTVRGTDLSVEEMQMGGGLRIVMHVMDGSYSMHVVGKDVRSGFGQEYIAAIKEGRQDDVSALRLGGVVFSDTVKQVWNSGGIAFHEIDKLPALTAKDYNPENGGSTALHQAIIEAYNIALEYAAQVLRETGIQPEIDIIVFTDGYNNCSPFDKSEIKKLIKGSKPELVRWIYFFFETETGACQSTDPDVNPEMIAKALGFDTENIKSFEQVPGETAAERRSRFRRMMRVMSKVSASKGVSAVAAAAATPAPAPVAEEIL